MTGGPHGSEPTCPLRPNKVLIVETDPLEQKANDLKCSHSLVLTDYASDVIRRSMRDLDGDSRDAFGDTMARQIDRRGMQGLDENYSGIWLDSLAPCGSDQQIDAITDGIAAL